MPCGGPNSTSRLRGGSGGSQESPRGPQGRVLPALLSLSLASRGPAILCPSGRSHAQPPCAAVALQRPSWPRTVPPRLSSLRQSPAVGPVRMCVPGVLLIGGLGLGLGLLWLQPSAVPRTVAPSGRGLRERPSSTPPPGRRRWGRTWKAGGPVLCLSLAGWGGSWGGRRAEQGALLRPQSGRADPVTTTVFEQAGSGPLPPGLGRLPQPADRGGECGAPLDGTGAESGTGRGSALRTKPAWAPEGPGGPSKRTLPVTRPRHPGHPHSPSAP